MTHDEEIRVLREHFDSVSKCAKELWEGIEKLSDVILKNTFNLILLAFLYSLLF